MRLLAFLLGVVCLAGAGAAQDFTTLKGHGGPIMAVAVSPTGQVASASFDNALGLWHGREPIWLDGHAAAVTTLVFGPDGRLYSGGDDFAVILWEGLEPRELGHHKGKVASLAVSPDGAWLASGSWDGSVRLWPIRNGSARNLPDPGSNVNAVAFSADGQTLFAATAQGILWRYDLTGTGGAQQLVRHGFGINRIVLGEGWLAYGAVDGGTRVIDPETGAEIADFTLDRRPILAMDYHASTRQLAVGDGQGYIMIVDMKEMRIDRDFRAAREGPVWALAYSRDGLTIWAGGLDDVVYGWPVALLDNFEPEMGADRSFLREVSAMPNGERQFMRKCSICHALDAGPTRKAGPSLHGIFGRRAGTYAGYSYSDTLVGSEIIWNADTIDALFDQGPDHYIPGSKMPMQVIARSTDRADLIEYLSNATGE